MLSGLISYKRVTAFGYGIRYEHGIFKQEFEDGWQRERQDEWLSNGYPWELIRPEYTMPVCMVICVKIISRDAGMKMYGMDFIFEAVPYDVPVIGYHVNTVNMLRLWKSQPSKDFD